MLTQVYGSMEFELILPGFRQRRVVIANMDFWYMLLKSKMSVHILKVFKGPRQLNSKIGNLLWRSFMCCNHALSWTVGTNWYSGPLCLGKGFPGFSIWISEKMLNQMTSACWNFMVFSNGNIWTSEEKKNEMHFLCKKNVIVRLPLDQIELNGAVVKYMIEMLMLW